MIGVSFGECQAWYHRAPGRTAVLLCSAHGFEDLCARRSWRILAERLALARMPVLRFDYPGTANSAGGDEDAELVARWRESVVAAANWLTRETDAREVVVVGLRLGALLAAIEAPRIEHLKGLALLAPVSSGRLYTREMSVLSKIMQPPNAAAITATGEAGDGAIDVCGFRVTTETATDLKMLNLAAPPSIAGAPVLLMHQKGASIAPLAKAYASLQCPVVTAEFAGYDEMICDPTASKVPSTAVDAIVDWAASIASTQLSPTSIGTGTGPAPSPAALVTSDWIESAVTFGEQQALAGILCIPRSPNPAANPVIICNSGMSYHIGWSRMSVRHARALAAAGIPSLRYDAAGIGDSLADEHATGLPLYNTAAEASLTAAIDFMSDKGLAAPIVLGACSGAYTAFHVTRADPRVKRAILVNLQCFEWKPSFGFEIERWRAIRRSEITAGRTAEDPAVSGLSSGAARLSAAALKLVRVFGRLAKRFIRSGLIDGPRAGNGKIALWLAGLSASKTEITLVYSEGDPGLASLAVEAGPKVESLTSLPGVSLETIANADHNLTPRKAQDDLLAIILKTAKVQRSSSPSAEEARVLAAAE
ncbi:MAG: hypothetical protein WC807_11770 [Hyphomicrobium sp.]|jgi:pimeloyl-ACP methyl ester carboxylesterase